MQTLVHHQLRSSLLSGFCSESSSAGSVHQQPRREAPAILLEGPLGCGKTTLCAALVAAAFPNPTSFCWLSMLQYSGADGVAKLLGPPPGTVGHQEGGVLTQQIRKRRRFLLVMEDIPAAHSTVHALLSTLLETGSLTVGSTKYDCRHITLLATHNTLPQSSASQTSSHLPCKKGAVTRAEHPMSRPSGGLHESPDGACMSKQTVATGYEYQRLIEAVDRRIEMAPLGLQAGREVAQKLLERVAADALGWRSVHVCFSEAITSRLLTCADECRFVSDKDGDGNEVEGVTDLSGSTSASATRESALVAAGAASNCTWGTSERISGGANSSDSVTGCRKRPSRCCIGETSLNISSSEERVDHIQSSTQRKRGVCIGEQGQGTILNGHLLRRAAADVEEAVLVYILDNTGPAGDNASVLFVDETDGALCVTAEPC
jgi:hypothetical protein